MAKKDKEKTKNRKIQRNWPAMIAYKTNLFHAAFASRFKSCGDLPPLRAVQARQRRVTVSG
jgi:hypothetical protein